MLIRDRVCGMDLDVRDVRESLEYEGRRYYFCSAGCRAEFERHPAEYAEKDEAVSVEKRDV